MLQPLEQSLLDAWPKSAWAQTRLLVAVSGGADSVALLRAMLNLSDQPQLLHVAHFNHQWRGEESDGDEQFVRDLCSRLDVHLTCRRASEASNDIAGDRSSQGKSVRSEQVARELRYAFLTQTAYSLGARYVVTAHSASDRVETALHNLCRGTGLAGVAVPTQFRDLDEELVLARPLLHVTRTQVLQYLDAIDQSYRCDSSNSDETLKRNFIRHRVLPLLRETYGEHVDDHLLNYSHLAEEATEALRFYALQWLDLNIVGSGRSNELMFSVAAVATTPWPVVRLALEICWKRHGWPLQPMTREHWLQIRELSTQLAPAADWNSQFNLPGNLQVAINRTHIRISSPIARQKS